MRDAFIEIRSAAGLSDHLTPIDGTMAPAAAAR
jgi:hypothetical protein